MPAVMSDAAPPAPCPMVLERDPCAGNILRDCAAGRDVARRACPGRLGADARSARGSPPSRTMLYAVTATFPPCPCRRFRREGKMPFSTATTVELACRFHVAPPAAALAQNARGGWDTLGIEHDASCRDVGCCRCARRQRGGADEAPPPSTVSDAAAFRARRRLRPLPRPRRDARAGCAAAAVKEDAGRSDRRLPPAPVPKVGELIKLPLNTCSSPSSP